ncbi:restriction endonuclease subunit S [Campylobacter upsaliensis]|uniref:restriction endonuclease subunit S n=1 Tax=Campylobacter upsaliensis TaxID=28080 RepID=UPI002B399A09|nr:restriction endonuclease subunit S [Campylobacter upsaliensis]MEB2791042.1 restriction endonuclease subunit S [Campylobacter upsaliensis]
MKKHTQSPYESSKVSYKPSGIEWLGEIPQSWEIRRLKHLTILFTGESIKDADKDKYSIVENAIPYIATKDIGLDSNDVNYNNGMFIQNDDTGFKRAYKNSTLLCLEGANAGKKIAFLNQEVCFVNKLCCISNKSKELDSKALFYFFQGSFFKNTFFSNISGLIGGVTTTQLGNFKIPLPPLQEQKEIAEFLDSKCEKIQNYIDKKQKLITLLQEKKQALINEAVCGRVACHTERSEVSTTAYKPSGIEYLGLIPHHWEVRRMKFMASIHNGREQTEIADENGIYPIYGSGGILGKSMYFIYDKPSVLLGRKGTIDKPLFVEEPFWTIDTMFYTSVSKIVLPKYFYYLCLTIDFQFYISGSAIPSMTQYDLANISFALPPLQEQKQIANFLDEKCEKINSAIEKTKRQIKLIKEYKNTLINEAVCGRINLQKKERI